MEAAQRKTIRNLLLIVVGMVGFVCAMVPLYGLLCDITGLNGKTKGLYTYDPASEAVDKSRTVFVNFVTNTNGGMAGRFWTEDGGLKVHPGQPHTVNFYVTNTSDHVVVTQAVPSLVPGLAIDYFHKTECFCFEQQVLQPGETREMPMRFIVDAKLPQNMTSLSLSYAMFDVTELVDASVLASGGNKG
ncbi:MAG: cytochrome c oxidase assembly protein [Pseudomonadales bacterium]|nr:cytochrome c oxidase assembly protein [Pseudomonadales bacterium]MCP5183506.1 cytochrome c oxidase assembly protein [Pseudomonadales bacterium]